MMREREARRVRVAPVAVVATGVTVLSLAGSAVLIPATGADANALFFLGFVASSAAVGYLVASRRPEHTIGWLLVAVGLGFAVQDVTGRLALYGLVTEPGSVPGARLLVWPQTWLWVPPTAAVVLLLPMYFPDGKLLSRRWRPLLWCSIVWVIVVSGLAAVTPGDGQLAIGTGSGLENPAGIDGLRSSSWVIEQVAPTALLVLALPAVASLVVRYRRGDARQRAQLKWLAYGLVASLVLLPVGGVLIPALDPVVSLAFASIPVAIGVAVLRHRLYDIDLLINRTVVYVSLSAILLGAYLGVAAATDAVVADQSRSGSEILAAGLVVALFVPVRARAQAAVNRLMYGERDDPHAALSRLGQQLEATLTVDAVLPAVVGTVAATLRVPYVAVETHRHGEMRVMAEHGVRPVGDGSAPVRLTLASSGEVVGSLLVSPRHGDVSFSEADVGVLAGLTRQIGVAVHAVLLHDEAQRLADDLQRSRQRLVVAREEERRRLGRDLHDEVGPRLATLAMQVDRARIMLGTDPGSTETLLDAVLEQALMAVEGVRRVAYELRPPALDTLGLPAALRSHVATVDRSRLDVELDAPLDLPPLPAAVEIAAYRIVLEALHNVLRHAAARRCAIAIVLEPSGSLTITVTDDGRGLGDRWAPGVGLESMRERAGELGGAATIGPASGGGTRVAVSLPCGATTSTTVRSS